MIVQNFMKIGTCHSPNDPCRKNRRNLNGKENKRTFNATIFLINTQYVHYYRANPSIFFVDSLYRLSFTNHYLNEKLSSILTVTSDNIYSMAKARRYRSNNDGTLHFHFTLVRSNTVDGEKVHRPERDYAPSNRIDLHGTRVYLEKNWYLGVGFGARGATDVRRNRTKTTRRNYLPSIQYVCRRLRFFSRI